MCGICGKLVFDGATPDPALIGAMAATLSHRGPDAVGVHTEAHVGLGQTRLAIIDLRAESNPPLANDDRTIWIVLNGEIYNYVELRAELQAAGARFRTDSDTEVLLRLYEARGIDCLQALRGMFAFAIWDARAACSSPPATGWAEALLLHARCAPPCLRLGDQGDHR